MKDSRALVLLRAAARRKGIVVERSWERRGWWCWTTSDAFHRGEMFDHGYRTERAALSAALRETEKGGEEG